MRATEEEVFLPRHPESEFAATGGAGLVQLVPLPTACSEPRSNPDAPAKIRRNSIEYNVVEHCNLRCAGCDHASPQLPRRFADLDSFRRDFAALASVFHARELRLIGGEPLLHPRLLDFLEAGRELNIADRLMLVTNGVLLHRVDQRIYELIDMLWISVYPGVEIPAGLAAIRQRAKRHGVRLILRHSPTFRHTLFQTKLTAPRLVTRIYRGCDRAHNWEDHVVYDGHYYKCPPAPLLRVRLAAMPDSALRSGSDGVPLHGNPNLRQQLAQYLSDEKPLNACYYCLGSLGRDFNHHQLSPDRVRQSGRVDETNLETLLERNPFRLLRRAVARKVGRSAWRRAISHVHDYFRHD